MYLSNADLILMITISLLIKCIRMKEFGESLFTSESPVPFRDDNPRDLTKFLKDFQLRIAIGLFIFALLCTIVVELFRLMKIAVSVIGRNVVVFLLASIASMLLMIVKPSKFLLEKVILSLLEFITAMLIHIIKKDKIHHQMWRRHLGHDGTSNIAHNRSGQDHTHLI